MAVDALGIDEDRPMTTEAEGSRGKRSGFWSRLHRGVVAIEPWGILVAVVALVLTVVQFWADYQDRVNERVVRAWTLVTTPAPGNSGKIDALEYLNREDGWLCFEWLWDGCVIVLKSRSEFVEIDLSPWRLDGNAFLVGVDLQGANLQNAILSKANLKDANLSEADLSEADLSSADLSGADLSGAKLKRADFTVSRAPGINLAADLSGADLSGADLTEARLAGVDLSGANLSKANLFIAKLEGANLFFANLTGADLTKTNLRDATLMDANLSEANLFDAGLYGALLRDADLSGANLEEAKLDDADLSGANLTGVRGLSQQQLDAACTSFATPPVLPQTLTWNERRCP